MELDTMCFLRLAPFTPPNYLRSTRGVVRYQWLIPFCCSGLFLCVEVPVCVSIHLLTDVWVDSTFWLL